MSEFLNIDFKSIFDFGDDILRLDTCIRCYAQSMTRYCDNCTHCDVCDKDIDVKELIVFMYIQPFLREHGCVCHYLFNGICYCPNTTPRTCHWQYRFACLNCMYTLRRNTNLVIIDTLRNKEEFEVPMYCILTQGEYRVAQRDLLQNQATEAGS
jgi:hypothetical protein